MQARSGHRRRETAEERQRIQVHRHRSVREGLLERDPGAPPGSTGYFLDGDGCVADEIGPIAVPSIGIEAAF